MMRRTSLLLLCGLLLAACTALDEANPYEGVLGRLTVRLRYPGEHASWCREGVEVTATDRQSGNRYTARTDAQGEASFRMPNGLYALAVSDRADSQTLFNGAVEQLRLTAGGEAVAELELRYVRPGGIVIREIYTGGCPATPATGSYVYDKYVILHNNDSETRYLDGLCLGMVDPYNSKGASGNYWTSLAPDGGILFRDYASVPDAVWQFPGSGRDFPLAPGADAVVALNGAVDHTATYPLSVNLNGEGYFVCYNETYYPDTRSHPVPGDRIDPARHLRLLKKTGLAKVYVISNNSPAVILYRAPRGVRPRGLPGRRWAVAHRAGEPLLYQDSVGVAHRRGRGLRRHGHDQRQAPALGHRRRGGDLRRPAARADASPPTRRAGLRGGRLRHLSGYEQLVGRLLRACDPIAA